MTDAADSSIYQQVDAAMLSWRQGDIAQVQRFSHAADLRRPVTSASIQRSSSSAATDASPVLITTAVEGLVVLTQTCDIRRTSRDRPYVEVCPVITVDAAIAASAASGERPSYAALPVLGNGAVADLDRVMTVEKGWLSLASRVAGWTSDSEIRRFQAAVSRRYVRFAFPDDFTAAASKLREKIVSRHGKLTSPEGQLFSQVEQVRVSAVPSWSGSAISVTLSFILAKGVLGEIPEEIADTEQLADTLQWLSSKQRSSFDIAKRLLSEADLESKNVLWTRLAEAWARSCVPTGSINAIFGEARDAGEYSVSEYWESSQLDLDHLSVSIEPAASEQPPKYAAAPLAPRRGLPGFLSRLLHGKWS
jgi:hypothetical protein